MRFTLAAFFVVAAASLFAQEATTPKTADTKNPYQQIITEQFGDSFKLDAKFAPLTGDFDGDGVPDLMLVSFGKNPMAEMNAKNFRVSDPYDAYFGFGDPKVTIQFAGFGDGTKHCVLIIHDYQSATPKGKFVIVNLPFEKLSLGSYPFKKKTVTGIATTEEGGLNAIIYWNGKKYKWEPTDFNDDTSQLDQAAK
jgi:hypothetical protein